MRIARRFNAGNRSPKTLSPEGTDEGARGSAVPTGLDHSITRPGVETPGYSQLFLRNRISKMYHHLAIGNLRRTRRCPQSGKSLSGVRSHLRSSASICVHLRSSAFICVHLRLKRMNRRWTQMDADVFIRVIRVIRGLNFGRPISGMKAIDGYFLIKPEDLSWKPANPMKVPYADFLERTKSEILGARLWRLPPKSANTLHKHVRAEEFYFVVE